MADVEKKNRKSKNMSKNLNLDQTNHSTTKPEVLDLIAKRLRGYFEEVSNQPVPDRFMELLDQLEAKTPSKKLD